jgi:hypothetical protein
MPKSESPVIVIPPPEAEEPDGILWVLQKSLYGIQEAPFLWYSLLRSILLKMGLKELAPCFFGSSDTLIIAYVDDILIASRLSESVIQNLRQHFEITVSTQNLRYLGINITFVDKKTIYLDQRITYLRFYQNTMVSEQHRLLLQLRTLEIT